MNLISAFHSDLYESIQWEEALKSIARRFYDHANSFGLLNSHNIVLMVDNKDVDFINLLSKDGLLLLHKSALNKIQSPEQSMQSLFYLNDNSKLIGNHSFLSLHDFISDILEFAIKTAKTIFSYTYTHLSNRQYGEKTITQIETVQNQFSKVVILFESINLTKNGDQSIEQRNFLFLSLFEILKTLSQLGGARAVLKNNAVDFMCHLKLLARFVD